MKNEAQIKVFVTKTRELRAKIKENKESIPYEVTIGGESWKNGRGRKYEKDIKRKCEILISMINSKMGYFDEYQLSDSRPDGICDEWWCPNCKRVLDDKEVTFDERHDKENCYAKVL